MRRPVRVLMAWFEPRDAVAAQLGFRLPNDGEDVSAQTARFEAMHAHARRRPPFAASPQAPLEPLPHSLAARSEALLQALRQGDAGARPLRAGVVDLRRLLSLQRAVALDDFGERVARASPGHWASLADLCLALPDAGAEEIEGTFDKDGKGVTITSVNPNLRVTPLQTLAPPGRGGAGFLGFQVVFGTRHLHVARYRDRLFLKDGYHRAYGLLSRGITHVPCVLEEADHFQAVHAGGTTLVAPEHLLGAHPPHLADFLDDEVSATVDQQFFRKVVRIRAEEFVVNV